MKAQLPVTLEEKLEHFRTHRKPQFYVLFEAIRHLYNRESGHSEITSDIFCLDVSSVHGHVTRIQQYLDKGWKLLEWKLPLNADGKIDKSKFNPYEGLSNFGDDVDHMEELNSFLTSHVHSKEAIIAEANERTKKLEEELADMKKKVEAKEPKSNKKDD